LDRRIRTSIARITAPFVSIGALHCLLVGSANASVAGQGALANPHFMADGVILVYTNGNRTGSIPACGQGQPQRFALNSTTAAGKSQLAGLLAAHAAGKEVIIVGTGDCSVYSDSETINYFYMIG
jgi:hypothetical protein